jgi:beta-glucosidase
MIITAMKRMLVLLFVCAVSFGGQERPVHIFMIGDSTMAQKPPDVEPERGWGQMLQSFFDNSVLVSNQAVNGRSSKSFIDEGRWQKVLDSLHAGDYVIIQFGHNDNKPDPARHTDPFTTFKANLEKYVNDTRSKGGSPMLCTPIVRRQFDEKGNLVDTHGQYPAAMHQVARELNVPLLDLQLRTKNLVSDLGPEKSKSIFLYADPGAYPKRPKGVQDDTHLSPEGATAVARMALEEMRALKLPLVSHLKPWMDRALTPEARTAALIAAMTLDQKMQQMVGAPGQVPEIPECYGARHVPGIPELQVPTLRITNGPVGVGQNDCVPKEKIVSDNPFSLMGSRFSAKATMLPSAIGVAASFDPKVAAQVGDVIGTESRNLALHVLEGPGINLARVLNLGRNFEYFGEDPVLSGSMAVAEIKAIQSHGVIAMAKHLVANEQETNRFTVNEIIDDRVLHELYLLPFEMAVKDGQVGSVMCSYNSVGGSYMCENRHILSDVLRGQWGFKGYVQSDFFAVHSAAPALLAGMDHEMPGLRIKQTSPPQEGPWFTPANLKAALAAGQIRESDIDTALARRYAQMFKFGIFDRPVSQIPIDSARGGEKARSIGEQAAVLLKNAGSVLPLDAKTIRSIALIGQPDYAGKAVAGCCGGSSDVIPFYTVPPLEGMQKTLESLGSAAAVRLTLVSPDLSNIDDAIAAAKGAEVAIVFAGTLSEEGRDLPAIALPDLQDSMIEAVAAANPRTVVVLKDNAATLLPWINHVPAILEAWFPGQEDGNIVARLLFGAVNPSGKLPVTFPMLANDGPLRNARQYPGVDAEGKPVPIRPNNNKPTTVEYSEGLKIGYRWFDAQGIRPEFPFGYGLSYTTFRISKLEVIPKISDGKQPIAIQFLVENTGKRNGAEVPQVYVGLPASLGEPPKRLVAFEKVWLNPGEKRVVKVVIDPQASSHPFGYWDSATQQWKIAGGRYQIYLGKSSADIVARATVTLRSH